MGNLRVDNLLRRTVSLPRLLPDDTQAQHLIKTASEMDTRRALASVGLKDLGLDIKLDLKPKHAYLLLVTLGSGEFFGPNENADYNPEHDGKVVHFPEPCDPNVKSMTLGKGLESTHKTFGIHGAVYKHHKTEPEHDVPRSGDIVWDRWNSDMHRGEVIAELPEEKWTEELSLSEQGIPLMWSQGNGVPSDVCGRCGFVFTPKSKSRCRHIKLRKLCIEDDGIQNVIHCASALFYDMSFVGNNPADKIATALLRVASPEMAESTHSRRPSLKETMRIHHVCRYSPAAVDLAIHRAEMELDGTSVPGIRIACMPDPDKDAEFVKEARSEDSGKVLAVLHRLEIVLTPTQFARIFGPEAEPTGVSGYIDALPGAFRRLREEDPGYTDDAGYFPSQPPDSSLRRKLEPFKADFDIGETLRKPVVIVAKSASVPGSLRPTESGKAMAGEYAKYLRTCLATFAGPQAADRCVGIMNAGL